MTNKEIARIFDRLAKVMELHDENKFKIRSYASAYITLRKQDRPLSELSYEELSTIKGVGKAIAEKIIELNETGRIQAYQNYVDKTPEGIMEMLDIKGFGPKKIKTVWSDLGITTIGELLYACNENRLVTLKGFGQKTQETLKGQLEYYLNSRGKYHYATLIDEAEKLVSIIQEIHPTERVSLTGSIRRKMPVVEQIELITTVDRDLLIDTIEALIETDGVLLYESYPCTIHVVYGDNFASELLKKSASKEFVDALGPVDNAASEELIFANESLQYIPAELRETADVIGLAKDNALPVLIEETDLKGVIHNHSTYSDGVHTLEEMASYTKDAGYEYLVMSDHSKAAFYANGLSEERCIQQMEEIDRLNERYTDFKIYKSIECDILNDGSLDYSDEILQSFDLVISSVHTNLRMDKQKATARIIKAVEHPSTHILGHPTGRLLLSREGYPIDHKKVIDACVDNGVVIELNANPYRLDIDWIWIPYVLERGGMISINPDAHNKAHIHYMKYGVAVARKGGLTMASCLNAKDRSAFQIWVDSLS